VAAATYLKRYASMKRTAYSEAVAVAVKLLFRGFKSNDAALRSLKRRCPALGTSAAPLLSSATELLAAALLIVEAHLPSLFTLYKKGGEVAPSDIAPFASSLAKQFPAWPQAALEAALWSATVYQMR
jgi:hypothetical protein